MWALKAPMYVGAWGASPEHMPDRNMPGRGQKQHNG